MNILILGFSNLVRRRVLPALLDIDSVTGVDIASRHGVDNAQLPETWKGNLYADYSTALANTDAQLVYVSLVNSLHEQWAESALLAGKHLIIDKPAALSLTAAEHLASIAQKQDVCLAEATVFNHHPQYDAIQGMAAGTARYTRVNTAFSFPPFAAGDFRNFPELGGGALLDLGPYAAATSRLFFTEAPNRVVCRINSRHPETGIETAFSILADFPDGGSYTGHFGFDTEYVNRLTVFGPGILVTLDRAYTTPPELENTIDIRRSNVASTISAPAGDAFNRFFEHALACIEKNSWRSLSSAMLQDAAFREQLRLSAYEE